MKKRFTSLADYLANGPETQEELAARIGTTQATISRAASRGLGSFLMLKRIADATGIPLSSFAAVREAA